MSDEDDENELEWRVSSRADEFPPGLTTQPRVSFNPPSVKLHPFPIRESVDGTPSVHVHRNVNSTVEEGVVMYAPGQADIEVIHAVVASDESEMKMLPALPLRPALTHGTDKTVMNTSIGGYHGDDTPRTYVTDPSRPSRSRKSV